MDPETFEEFLEICQPHLPIGSSRNGRSLVPRERLLAFLHFLSGNGFMRHEGGKHRTSTGAIDQNVTLCIRSLFEPLVKSFISLPSEDQGRDEAELFHQKSRSVFPKVVFSAIDGTHIGNLQLNILLYPF